MRFDRVAVLDWSAARGAKRGKDSIWLGLADAGGVTAVNLPTRAAAEARLAALVATGGGRLLVGADFAFGWPAGFAVRLTGRDGALAVWDWLAARVQETPGNGSNFRQVAAEANAAFGGGTPFWGNGERRQLPGLPRRKPPLPPGLAEHRATELAAREGLARPKSVWQLAGAGAVGAQALTGVPVLARLRAAHPGRVAVWPFEAAEGAEVVLAEVYPSLLGEVVGRDVAAGAVPDEAQVRRLALALWRLARAGGLAALMAGPGDAEEGRILGAGHGAALRAAALQDEVPAPPRLRNDCFALPPGVDWMPVDEALARLRAAVAPVTAEETLPLQAVAGRVLARGAVAARAHPAAANAAVDGWGFAHPGGSADLALPPVAGRAAAGQPFGGAVPAGHALRILTGAVLPAGVDTVVLQEDSRVEGGLVRLGGGLKRGANTRPAGEDLAAGQQVLAAGHRLRAPDLALLAAAGVAQVAVRRRLRVAVLSTGDEIVEPGRKALPHQVFDANRPMLAALVAGWGHAVVDLGHAPDRAGAIRACLDRGAGEADAVLVSGGASAGDEDHVSRLLSAEGSLTAWRVAMKPGRPLALATWRGVPVFGLPGNPVAAMVCALVFGRPALSALAGGGWDQPLAMTVPAAFSKRKKAGRREYLRARLTPRGAAEVFASEGSGRVSGLAWATGLVELPDGALTVEPGDGVRFLPYAGFGV